MSIIAANCRGTVHVMTGGGGGGFYDVSPTIAAGGGGRVLIQSVPSDLREVVQPMISLDDKRLMGVFGSSWSEISVGGLILLGGSGGGGASAGAVLGWYRAHRVGKYRSPVAISAGGFGIAGYVVGLSMGETDAEFNKQVFTIHCLTAL